jgi:hypothetical protein
MCSLGNSALLVNAQGFLFYASLGFRQARQCVRRAQSAEPLSKFYRQGGASKVLILSGKHNRNYQACMGLNAPSDELKACWPQVSVLFTQILLTGAGSKKKIADIRAKNHQGVYSLYIGMLKQQFVDIFNSLCNC